MTNHDEQAPRPVAENELWLLSYYRSSEINGALFFGRVARTVRGPLQVDVTHHFADEANHASVLDAVHRRPRSHRHQAEPQLPGPVPGGGRRARAA